eukprot:jgi/Botrbrau1/20627/Bobra.113_1s0052.1
MHEAGQFLDLYSPERGRAGEARREQAWDALLAACMADQAQVLAWLLSQGWPAEIDAAVVWHLRDIAQQLCAGNWETLYIPGMPDGDGWFLPEVKLYLYAMRNPTSACLEVLLRAGCRSEWLCPLAAKEGRPAYLELAVNAGCPCDVRSLHVAAERGDLEVLQTVCLHADLPKHFMMMMHSLGQAAEIAAAKGHLSCVEALYQNYTTRYGGLQGVARAAASKGQLECLQFVTRFEDVASARPSLLLWVAQVATLPRTQHGTVFNELCPLLSLFSLSGWLPEATYSLRMEPEAWAPVAAAAAQAHSLPWLKHLVELETSPVDDDVLHYAAASGDLECLAFVHEAGFRWKLLGPYWDDVVARGNPAVLAFVLDHVDQPVEWDAVFWDPDWHPVVAALQHGDVACLLLAAEESRPPPAKEQLDCARAAALGEAALQCVAALGGILDKSTTAAAAGAGQLGALRFARESGAPWDVGILNAAVRGGSLECLQYAHQHGCPYVMIGAYVEAGVAHTVQVLRYVYEHMDPVWAQQVGPTQYFVHFPVPQNGPLISSNHVPKTLNPTPKTQTTFFSCLALFSGCCVCRSRKPTKLRSGA